MRRTLDAPEFYSGEHVTARQARTSARPRTNHAVKYLSTLLLALALGSSTLLAPATTTQAHAVAVARIAPSGISAGLGPLINIPQTWNNCGPASVAEVLAFYGITRTQEQVKAVLRADGNPYGMAPYGVPAYMRGLGMRALLGIAGTDTLLKALIANGFPVIVSEWVSLADHVGHYRPLQAYDDRAGVFVSSDPYLGQGHVIGYGEFDTIWATTNRRFMVLYPPARAALLAAVLSSARWSHTAAYREDLAHQQALLAGKERDRTGYGSHRNYYLAIAWDELQLRRFTAARQALTQAAHAGENHIVLGWVANELDLASAKA